VINPGNGPDQDPTAATRIVRFESTPNRSFAVADLTPAYAKNARRVWRGIALLDRDKVLVQDEIQADKPVEVWWFMHTPAGVSVESDGRVARLKQVGAELHAEILSPLGARFEMMDAEPLPSSPHPAGQARNERVKKLVVHLTGISDSRLAVLLVPGGSRDTRPSQTVELSALSEW